MGIKSPTRPLFCKRAWKISAVLMALLMVAGPCVNAQTELLDITQMAHGTVKEIKAGAIRLIRDSNSMEVRIATTKDTEYSNAQRLADLKKGDNVQVTYQTFQGRNMAITITKVGGGEV